jgi:RNA polymerase sigma factor for flagellar operon FliA
MNKAYTQTVNYAEELLKYTPLVKRVAYQVASKLPANVEVDDLIQEGLIGLLDALKKYVPQANLSFEVYARMRIKGSIYDSCRKNDILPRNQRDDLSRLEKLHRQLEQELGRPPTEGEIAQAADLSLEAYFGIMDGMVNLMPIDDLSDDLLPADASSDPLHSAAMGQFADQLALILKKLPEKEQMVMALHYQEDLSYREIAEVLNLTTGRISQIHTQCMIRIRSHLKVGLAN